jgi:integrase
MLERGLSHTTVLHVHRVLKKMLNCAVQWGVIIRNPADGATPPKRGKKQMHMWDRQTIHRFLDESQGTRFAPVFDFAISTGMRRSEICGLKWDAVDLVNGRLEVKATLQRLRGHGLVTGTPKTERSCRNIALAPETVELLQVVQGSQQLAKIEAGPLWQGQGYVFTHLNGTPLIPDQITQDFAAVIKRFDLPHLAFHGLRHAFATLALKQNIHPKIVSEALGHSKIGITMNLYSHVIPDMQDELADAVADVLSG